MSHKKNAEHQPSDEELKEKFAESMEQAIEEKQEKAEKQEETGTTRFVSSNIPSEMSDEEFWKKKLTS
jgi:hypothetical protein